MKKNLRNQAINLLLTFGFLSLIGITPIRAQISDSNSDLNATFAFKKIFVSSPKDNVDGAYLQPVTEAFADIFEKNPRFELVDNIALADTVVESTITKKTNATNLEIRLVLNPSQELFVTETQTLPATATGGELVNNLKQLLKTALKRIPFYGTVSGKDGESVTFDIGSAQGLMVGDIVQVSRVERVKRHPLLKTIIDIELIPVGSVEITEVEDSLAFGKLGKLLAGEEVRKLHKVTAIESRMAPKKESSTEKDPITGQPVISHKKDEIGRDDERPKMGYITLGPFLGSFSSTSSNSGGLVTYSGSAFAPGIRAGGELWITKNWFADLGLGFNSMTYSQVRSNDTTNASPSTGQTTRSFDLGFGYRYLIQRSIFGPQAHIKMGYRNFSWSPVVSTATLLTPKSYSGFNLGIGGSLPIENFDYGILTSVNIILFGALDESGNRTALGESSITAVNFFLGGYYFINLKIGLRAGFFFDSYAADFVGTSETSASTSQKQIGFLPSIQYYF